MTTTIKAFAKLHAPVPIPTRVMLNMSLLEARTLKQLCMATAGDPCVSARKHTDAIREAFTDAGVTTATHSTLSLDIFFDDEERSTL